MKHWNKLKGISNWTTVQFGAVGINAAAKHWCQNNGSKDRFYIGRYIGCWKFENSEDALAFKLKWANQKV